MRKLMIMLMVLCAFGAAWATRTVKIGKITAAETWSDTIHITGDVICTSAVITIQPGTVVWFDTLNQRVTSGESDPAHIHLIVKRNGAINAMGTAQAPILFTTRSANKIGGKWGKIDIMAAIDTVHTAFQYCTFECAYNAFDFRATSDSWQSKSRNRFMINHCTIRSMERGGLYITSGGSPVVTNCLFYNLRNAGVFAHGAQNVDISYCTFYNMSVALINAGELWGGAQVMTVDHVTIDSVNGARSSSNQWWTGIGVYCSSDPIQHATLRITNSIIANVATFTNFYNEQSRGILLGAAAVSRDYNCYYRTGYSAFETGDVAGHEFEENPFFIDPRNPTLGLAWNSPCLNAAGDGTHLGAWQGTVGIRDQRGDARASLAAVRVTPNPFTAQAGFTFDGKQLFNLSIFTLDGYLVKECGAAVTRADWDGTDRTGSRIRPGVYVYRLTVDGQVMQGRVMLAH